MRGGQMSKKILIASFLMALAGCDQKPQAPFGFEWGQTIEKTKSQNLRNMDLDYEYSYVTFIHADSAPEPSVYSGKYFLAFRPKFGLTNISFSKDVDQSSMLFDEGRKIYNDIAEKLEEKYGKPLEVNEKMDRDGTEFYDCLSEKGCGKWERKYKNKDVSILLKMQSVGRLIPDFAKASVNVQYEYFTDDMRKEDLKSSSQKGKDNSF